MIYYKPDEPSQICIDPECGDWPLFYLFGLAELGQDADRGFPEWLDHHVDWVASRQFTPNEWLGDQGAYWRKVWQLPEPSMEFKQRWLNFYDRNKGMTLAQVIAGIEIFLDQWDNPQ